MKYRDVCVVLESVFLGEERRVICVAKSEAIFDDLHVFAFLSSIGFDQTIFTTRRVQVRVYAYHEHEHFH